jgi:hypothetical protein
MSPDTVTEITGLEPTFSAREAAALLGRSYSWLDQRVRNGEFVRLDGTQVPRPMPAITHAERHGRDRATVAGSSTDQACPGAISVGGGTTMVSSSPAAAVSGWWSAPSSDGIVCVSCKPRPPVVWLVSLHRASDSCQKYFPHDAARLIFRTHNTAVSEIPK